VEEEGDVASCCCGWFYFVGICNGICKGNKSLKMICLTQIILTNMMDKTSDVVASFLHDLLFIYDRWKFYFLSGDVAAQLEMI